MRHRNRSLTLALSFAAAIACGDAAPDAAPSSASPAPAAVGAHGGAGVDAAAGIDGSTTVDAGRLDAPDGAATVPCPSTGTWSSLIPGPGQSGFDAVLAAAAAKRDRFHEALGARATGLGGASVNVTIDGAARTKLADMLAAPWSAGDIDPTDDLMQYAGIDPAAFVTAWGMAPGMYAGADLAADAFRYAVLRDRGGDCTELARARRVLQDGIDALHVAVAITGTPGSIARALARKDLPGDGQAPVVPLFDANHQPLPAEKDNGTWRADNSAGGLYPHFIWWDSCSRDMLFGWTLAFASAWEVVESDPSFSASVKAQLRADAKSILDGLRIVRPSGKDLELWDADGRRTFHGNLHETSVDRAYVVQNGVASMMALGEVAALVSVVADADAKGYLATLTGARGLPAAINQSMFVTGLAGDKTNYSSYNMLFFTAWMAHRYIDDANVRAQLKKPTESDLYAPLFGERPSEWKQSLFDLVVAASTVDAWRGAAGAASKVPVATLANALETLNQFPPAPFFATTVENCDANEIAASACVLNDGVTYVSLHMADGSLVANKPVPMSQRPFSNFFWRSNPFEVNAVGDSTVLYPAADFRLAYWLGRYVRVN